MTFLPWRPEHLCNAVLPTDAHTWCIYSMCVRVCVCYVLTCLCVCDMCVCLTILQHTTHIKTHQHFYFTCVHYTVFVLFFRFFSQLTALSLSLSFSLSHVLPLTLSVFSGLWDNRRGILSEMDFSSSLPAGSVFTLFRGHRELWEERGRERE